VLKTRIITAVVLVVALLAVIFFLPPIATVIAVTAMVIAGAWEWSAFLRAPAIAIRAVYVVVVVLLLWAVWQATGTPRGRNTVLLLALIWWIVALAWIVFAPRQASTVLAAIAGVLALVPSWMALIQLRYMSNGAEWMLFVLVLVWAADIGAYFVGRKFGRTRLAPAVSPGKTWEGVFGGVALSALVAFAGAYYFGVPSLLFIGLCIAVVAFSIVGDLTESLLKRFAGLKDSGTLFPGHGGVMDRIDSVTSAAPVLFFGLIALGVAK
jgi:phosphatidate cytidylyltransferase